MGPNDRRSYRRLESGIFVPGTPRVREVWGADDHVRAVVRDAATGELVEATRFHNEKTTAGKNWLRDLLLGLHAFSTILYVAVGDDATAPAAGDTQLGNEVYRKAVTDRESDGDGALLTTMYLAGLEFVGQIEEVGWFGSDQSVTASGSANSGRLIARALYSRNKTDDISITFERGDSFA